MTLELNALAVGGMRFGQAQDSCLGLQFNLNEQNLVQYFSASVVSILPSLTTARYLHQAVILRTNNAWTLFVAGGKNKQNWLASTEKLDLTPYFKKGLTVRNKEGIVESLQSTWVQTAPMLSARANFAMVAIKDSVYAIGGIAGRQSAEAHRALLSNPVERYTVSTDKWEQLSIANLPALAAFAWTPLGDSGKIAILGGTNGSIMQDEVLVVDLKKETVENLPAAYPFFTGLGHLAFREQEKTLYSFGGVNSQGVNYTLRLDDKEWQQSGKQHTVVTNLADFELLNNTSVYFAQIDVDALSR